MPTVGRGLTHTGVEMINDFCIFRSRDQGVVCGYMVSMTGQSAVIREARQIHGWQRSANTLFEASNVGLGVARISEPGELDFLMLGICGVYRCTPKAKANLSQSRWNKDFDSSASDRGQRKKKG